MSDDIKRCPKCMRPVSQGHAWRCPDASIEEKAAGAEREIEGYWKGQVERLEAHARRSHAITGAWHGKYMLVKVENNKLRRKLYQREKGKVAEPAAGSEVRASQAVGPTGDDIAASARGVSA